MPLQSYCSKCPNPLEVLESRLTGLGDKCASQVLACFEHDRKDNANAITGDALFNLLAIFADPNTVLGFVNQPESRAAKAARLGIASEQEALLADTCLALINCKDGADLTAQTVLNVFSLSRTAKDDVATALCKALADLGYKRMLAMARGEANPEVVQFSYNPQAKDNRVLTLECTTRRKAAELLNLLPSALKYSGRYWRFTLRDAPRVFEIVSLYFPFTPLDTALVRDLTAQAQALPPEEIKRYYRVVEPEDPFVFYSWPLVDDNGNYFMSYAESGAFRDTLKARGCALVNLNNEWIWMVPESQAEWLQAELDARLVPATKKGRGAATAQASTANNARRGKSGAIRR